MFDFLKKKQDTNIGGLDFSSSGKKKSFFDVFKVNPFILFMFFFLIAFTSFAFVEATKNAVEIKKIENEQAQNYKKLIDISNTLGYLNGLKVQKFDGTKVVDILNYLEELEFYSYKLEFNSNKQYFFVNLKGISEEKLNSAIDHGLKSGVLNYFRTNETIKVIEEGRVSITLIFK